MQYYEMFGCRALYQDGWKAVAYHDIQVDEPGARPGAVGAVRPPRRPVRVPRPRRRRTRSGSSAMVERWWAEAERNHVLPLDNRPFSELVFERTSSVAPRQRYVYWPGRAPVPESVAVNVRNRPHTITAHVTDPDDVDPSKACSPSQGSVLGGWSFHLRRRAARATCTTSPAGASTGSSAAAGVASPRATTRSRCASTRPHADAARRRRGRRRPARSSARCGAGSRSPAPGSPSGGRPTSPPPTRTTAAASIHRHHPPRRDRRVRRPVRRRRSRGSGTRSPRSRAPSEHAIESFDDGAGDEDRLRSTARVAERAASGGVHESERGRVHDHDVRVEERGALHGVLDGRRRARVELTVHIDDDHAARPGHPYVQCLTHGGIVRSGTATSSCAG